MGDSVKPDTAQLLSEIQKGATLKKTETIHIVDTVGQLKLQKEIEKGVALKKAETIHTVDTVGQLKLQNEIEKGVALKKVPRPSTELSEAARQAFVEANQK